MILKQEMSCADGFRLPHMEIKHAVHVLHLMGDVGRAIVS